MIITVTLNPAVDKTLRGSGIILGNVNRMEEVKNIAGGKGINVSKVLSSYGYKVKALGFAGGYSGDMIMNAVTDMGIENCFTRIEGETRTSINVIGEDGYVTEILEPGPEVKEAEKQSFLDNYEKEIIDCDMVIISGSAPKGVESSFYVDLINIANKKGIKVLLDASGDNLKKGMYARPFFLKPNIKELESLVGKKLRTIEDVTQEAEQLVEWGIKNVMVSLGSKGIVYAYMDGDDIKSIFMEAPKMKVVNTVGSGDCVVAAFAMAQCEKLTREDTLKHCIAISAANVTTPENGVVDKDLAKEIENKL